jgi:hypothetical protein
MRRESGNLCRFVSRHHDGVRGAGPASLGRRPGLDPLAEAAQNVRMVGCNDLQGVGLLQITTRSDTNNGNWAYVGPVRPTEGSDGAREGGIDDPQLNPITGR